MATIKALKLNGLFKGLPQKWLSIGSFVSLCKFKQLCVNAAFFFQATKTGSVNAYFEDRFGPQSIIRMSDIDPGVNGAPEKT